MPKTEPFEKHALQYEEWFEKNKFAYKSELQAVRKHLQEGEKGVETGAGTGRFAAPLGSTIGVEPSTEMGKIAKRRGIEVIVGVILTRSHSTTIVRIKIAKQALKLKGFKPQ